jgi:hypothetical protein
MVQSSYFEKNIFTLEIFENVRNAFKLKIIIIRQN